ncbi:tetratricopeptide repeat-containing glycosyltransferase family protein [Phenylobacterium sp.]|uniref:tetratricopeptide repeat-containing glycosyltransferase family protein n=1 Tax=Phenylobacterium sp. TaxID=1871053 RepID=UPI002DE541EC|nr:tetratricopeptide repeat-containing glycosyltransferase family protein [Phenylobacterium sp.]
MSEAPTPSQPPLDAAFAEAARLQQQGDFAQAAEAYGRLAAKALTVNIAVNLGLCLTECGRFSEAEPWLTLAASHRPQAIEIRRLLGVLYSEMGDVERAEQQYRAGLQVAPDDGPLRLALAGLLLSVGRYREGWPLLEARVALHPDVVPPIDVGFPEWRGEDLAGRAILVWYEQGLGDQIQFARFAQGLKAAGAGHVALGCRPALAALLATAPGVDEVVPVARGETVAIRDYDVWSRYFSLAGHLGVTLETVPGAPYLSAAAGRRERWRGFEGVGLVWRASPTGFNARNKNVPDDLARRLLDRGALSLHPEDTGAADFADTAAMVEQLDLVISIDTSVAHLAGAMGKPCWTLIPRLHADWRWLRDRDDSPWYPSMRLYRQAEPGDWAPLIARLEQDLDARRG